MMLRVRYLLISLVFVFCFKEGSGRLFVPRIIKPVRPRVWAVPPAVLPVVVPPRRGGGSRDRSSGGSSGSDKKAPVGLIIVGVVFAPIVLPVLIYACLWVYAECRDCEVKQKVKGVCCAICSANAKRNGGETQGGPASANDLCKCNDIKQKMNRACCLICRKYAGRKSRTTQDGLAPVDTLCKWYDIKQLTNRVCCVICRKYYKSAKRKSGATPDEPAYGNASNRPGTSPNNHSQCRIMLSEMPAHYSGNG